MPKSRHVFGSVPTFPPQTKIYNRQGTRAIQAPSELDTNHAPVVTNGRRCLRYELMQRQTFVLLRKKRVSMRRHPATDSNSRHRAQRHSVELFHESSVHFAVSRAVLGARGVRNVRLGVLEPTSIHLVRSMSPKEKCTAKRGSRRGQQRSKAGGRECPPSVSPPSLWRRYFLQRNDRRGALRIWAFGYRFMSLHTVWAGEGPACNALARQGSGDILPVLLLWMKHDVAHTCVGVRGNGMVSALWYGLLRLSAERETEKKKTKCQPAARFG